MSNPLSDEPPESPLGMTLREHIVNYLGQLADTIDIGNIVEPEAETIRALKAHYEDLSTVLECHDREIELRGGSDRLMIYVDRARTQMFLVIERNGDLIADISLTGDGIIELIDLCREVLAELS
ncbi:hypothetical protein OG203_44275 [Nocardia sp. NBC_01499]|uniref:hypothetical protein n=1 Tax=Nocardia sp. NBC_01499 TaxID=2903597 RepID=UPI00386E077E